MRLWMLLLLSIVAGCANEAPRPQSHGKTKTKDFDQEVLQSSTPVLVDFGATWCGPCREMEPILDRLEKDFHVVRIDVDRNPELASRYNIQSIPALLIFVDGKVAVSHRGVTEEAVLRADLTRLSAKSPG